MMQIAQKKDNQKKARVECSYCHKDGHLEATCFTKLLGKPRSVKLVRQGRNEQS